MSPCDTCPVPGHCCRLFTLNPTWWDDIPMDEQWSPHASRYPFVPVRKRVDSQGWVDKESGRTYSYWQFNCPKLGPDGRCTIYADRPATCRIFEPASSPLCVLWKGEPRPDFQQSAPPA